MFCYLTTLAAAGDAEADKHPFQLGHAYDLSQLSTWDFSTGLTHRNVLSWDGEYIGKDCHMKNLDCIPSYGNKIDQFEDLKQIMEWFSTETSFDVSFKYKDYWASLSATIGHKSSKEWFSNSAAAAGEATNMQGCHVLSDDCLMKFPGYDSGLAIDPVFDYTLQQMIDSKELSTMGTDIDVLEKWRTDIIARRGTHLCKRTDNGASIKTFTYADTNKVGSSQCAYNRICAGLGAYGLNFTVCHNEEGCQSGEETSMKWGNKCAAVGGDPKYIAAICDSGTKREERINFLSSGDTDSTQSVIKMYFLRLDTLLKQFGYPEEIYTTLGYAIDYHLCQTGMETGYWSWDTSDEDLGGQCMCSRECQNGGILDPDACTCKCQGDEMHGYTGENCEETYGFCTAGPGTGNNAAAQECASTGQCASAFKSYPCSPAEVCCLTAFGGACCPFGNTCHCEVRHCDCVPPMMLEDRLAALQKRVTE